MNGMTVALKVLLSCTDSRIFGTDGRSFFLKTPLISFCLLQMSDTKQEEERSEAEAIVEARCFICRHCRFPAPAACSNLTRGVLVDSFVGPWPCQAP
jgi:hypothetical protein